MTLDFTVVIPVYNGAERVSAVLDRLNIQTGLEAIHWEVVVVDNNSSDDLAEVIQNYQSQWREDVPLRYCFEPRQGLAYARERGIVEAKGAWVGFLDDDNWPEANWVAAAVQFGSAHPQAGAFGGEVKGAFTTDVPAGFDRIKTYLVIRRYGSEPMRFQPKQLRLPAGAGLVVQQAAWRDSVPAQLHCIGGGGDDYEISLRMHQRGWEIWYCPEMVISHSIPPQRLEPPYLKALAYRYGLCTCELLMLVTPNWQRPLVLSRSFFGNLKRVIIHGLQHRNQVFNNLAIACYFSFFLGNVVSPFYYLKQATARLLQSGRSPSIRVLSSSQKTSATSESNSAS